MKFLKKYLWLICLIIGAIGSFIIMFLTPFQIYIDTILKPTTQITVFMLVIFAIAFFPNKFKGVKHMYLLLIAAIFTFLCYIIPRISYYGFIGIPNGEPNCYDDFYHYLWLYLYPAIIVTTCFAYRINGGTPGRTIKLGAVPVIGLFSGLLDIIWPITNRLPLPEILEANHIRIIIGHWPTYREAVIFTICHIPLAVIVLLLPMDKWFTKWGLLDESENM